MEHFNEDTWELLQDDHFIRWATQPDEASTRYWEAWMQEHPHRVDTLLKAKAIVQQLGSRSAMPIDPALPETIYTAIERDIDQQVIPSLTLVHRRRFPWRVAAAAAIAGICILFFFLPSKKGTTQKGITAQVDKQHITRTNQSNSNQVAYLADGSTVVLTAGASIRHDLFLNNHNREVFLEGNAFFDIAKDVERPFYVYAGKVGIRVLGTSFNVSADKSGNLTVMVRTGKVAVYDRNSADQNGYVVTPNHKISFNARTAAFIPDTVNANDYTITTMAPVNLQSFAFDDAPVNDIFSALEKAYGISIHADRRLFEKCRVTTRIDNESLENKLKIICAAINATYKISGDAVYITGKPCT
ncbi:FecR family protein [Chitinophaga vietnamensis]|uniref:FecR family protein n=1 Tax=Chitinophaga vietnamensis TaxID=2593957 RepID=UPI00117820EA|nr:FecR family protein [Chitinophaga vietnamensis]